MILQVPGSRVRLTGTSVSSRHVRLGSPKSLLAFLMMVWACRSPREGNLPTLAAPGGEGAVFFLAASAACASSFCFLASRNLWRYASR